MDLWTDPLIKIDTHKHTHTPSGENTIGKQHVEFDAEGPLQPILPRHLFQDVVGEHALDVAEHLEFQLLCEIANHVLVLETAREVEFDLLGLELRGWVSCGLCAGISRKLSQ